MKRVVNNAQPPLIALCSRGNMQANMQVDRGHAEQEMSVLALIAARGETVNAQLAMWAFYLSPQSASKTRVNALMPGRGWAATNGVAVP
jgi:hypothetical protein